MRRCCDTDGRRVVCCNLVCYIKFVKFVSLSSLSVCAECVTTGNTKTIALLLLLVLITSSAYTQHDANTVLLGGHDQVQRAGSKEWLLSLR